MVTLRTGGGAVPNARTACGAGLNKESAAIGADFGPGAKLETTARAGEYEPEPAIRAHLVLIVDGRPAAGTHDVTTLRAHPVRVVHRGIAGRAAAQFRSAGRQI